MALTSKIRPFACSTLALLCLDFFASKALGVSSPTMLPLTDQNSQILDPDMANWLREYADGTNPLELDEEHFAAFSSKWDPVSTELVRLRRPRDDKGKLNGSIDAEELAELNAKTQELIKEQAALVVDLRHPLAGSLAQEYLKNVRDADVADAQKLIADEPVWSCTTKSRMIDSFVRPKPDVLSSEHVLKVIETSKGYDSATHRRKLLEALAQSLPESRRAESGSSFR